MISLLYSLTNICTVTESWRRDGARTVAVKGRMVPGAKMEPVLSRLRGAWFLAQRWSPYGRGERMARRILECIFNSSRSDTLYIFLHTYFIKKVIYLTRDANSFSSNKVSCFEQFKVATSATGVSAKYPTAFWGTALR